jgi:hypothetical protein
MVYTGHRTPDTGHRTPDTGHRTPDTRHQTPDTRHQTPDTRHQTPDTRHQTPDTAVVVTRSVRTTINYIYASSSHSTETTQLHSTNLYTNPSSRLLNRRRRRRRRRSPDSDDEGDRPSWQGMSGTNNATQLTAIEHLRRRKRRLVWTPRIGPAGLCSGNVMCLL